MHEYKSNMLKCIAQKPRALIWFTHGPVHSTVSAPLLERYLAEMQAEGLTFERDDRHHITQAGLELLNKPTTKAEPKTWCACSQPSGSYVPAKSYARNDGHKHLQSRGQGT